MADVVGIINTGVGYILSALHLVRDGLTKVASLIPGVDSQLVTLIIFLFVSLWLGNMVTKKFVTRPFSGSYLLWTLVIAISIFMNLMYL